MKTDRLTIFSTTRVGAESALLTLSPLPVLFALLGTDGGPPDAGRLLAAVVAVAACVIGALTVLRLSIVSTCCCIITIVCGLYAAWPAVTGSPFAVLTATLIVIGSLFALLTYRPSVAARKQLLPPAHDRAWWSYLPAAIVILFGSISGTATTAIGALVIAMCFGITLMFFLDWAWHSNKIIFAGTVTEAIVFGTALLWPAGPLLPAIALGFLLLNLTLQSLHEETRVHQETFWWKILFDHPARVLLTTFLALCALGTALLLLPIATPSGTIDVVDAIFTAVSAVCVTGLIVLDTPNDFTMVGQFFIIFLIQLGGLGIMSIATVALHAIGRRLSLRHERLISSITESDQSGLLNSLILIIKFTLVAESIGMVLLATLFFRAGDSAADALWRGIFTAISAFCNAGFALQSDSLVPYQTNPLVIHVVATLIIAGGMAPATCLAIPRWLRRKRTPIAAKISLTTTAVLLALGTFIILAFEWHGALSGLSPADKLHNGWFQSVTLRTAGFNTVDIAAVASPTFLIMLCFMFIGGSPGGAAGGVKTTTIGVLALTFWAQVTNRHDALISRRRIKPFTIYRAITIVCSGGIIWLVIVFMLEATQQIAARDLVFEATSAIGTVGLSTGATGALDPIGKIIIIIAMFIGRIGPITLFMLLSNDQITASSRYLDADISLT
jgi:trk system potassium uptake protein TrkH